MLFLPNPAADYLTHTGTTRNLRPEATTSRTSMSVSFPLAQRRMLWCV